MVIRWIVLKIDKKTTFTHDENSQQKEPTGVNKFVIAVKNKYCPSIDWSDVKHKTKTS